MGVYAAFLSGEYGMGVLRIRVRDVSIVIDRYDARILGSMGFWRRIAIAIDRSVTKY